MNPATVFSVVTARYKNSRHWTAGTVTWRQIVAWADNPANHKECGGYVLGEIELTTVDHTDYPACTALHRGKNTIKSRSAITLDVDSPGPGFVDQLMLVESYAALVHTTFTSSPDAPRYRVVVPADRSMTTEEYHKVVAVLMFRLGPDQFDQGSVQPERYMYLPSAQQPGWFQSWEIEGEALDVDATVAAYTDKMSPLPDPTISSNKRNPLELAGVAGAFNRVYVDLDEVAEKYDLPYVPVGDNRWQLVGGTGEAGMGPIAEGLWFSHHITDPAGGQACSAFDLVRLHRFIDLDDDEELAKPVNRRASHTAMLDLAANDPRVIADVVSGDFSDGLDLPTDEEWKLGLALNARTGKIRDTMQNWNLIRDNDVVFTALYFNELSSSIEFEGDLPWRKSFEGGKIFGSVDRAALGFYIEEHYHFRPPRSLLDDLIITTAGRRRVHPLRSHLESLVWDGTPRVEECLPGVRPTEYTKMVARKSLVAAVARIMEPGCKWDHTLVLFGPEGIGKSYWVEKMALGYSAPLGPLNQKDTLLALQRSWIMISDEGHTLRKSDSEAQKEFLTRTEDVIRMPYERESVAHPRHCVIWGTTNDEVFLRRQQGNRRFLIVRCEDPVDFREVTSDYVNQLWAEAMHLYRAGELLFLEGEQNVEAAVEREQFTEEDALAGVLATYLDMLVPDNWDNMSPESRRIWVMNQADDMVPPGTQQITETCSMQMWVEALGRRVGEHKRTDLLEITTALRRLPGWEADRKQARLPHYGPQMVFRRITEDDVL